MNDLKLLENCEKCGDNLTLMGSTNMVTGVSWAVKRCLSCGQHPVEEVVELATLQQYRTEPCEVCGNAGGLALITAHMPSRWNNHCPNCGRRIELARSTSTDSTRATDDAVQRAIEQLATVSYQYQNAESDESVVEIVIEQPLANAIDLAITALRAQIGDGWISVLKPKKLRRIGGFIYGDCSCGHPVKTCESYCCCCGQKLDWILDDRGVAELSNPPRKDGDMDG